MQPDDKYLHQTLARNMTDSELANRIYADGDSVLPEYTQEATRRFGGFQLVNPIKQAIQEDISGVFDDSPSIRDAYEELNSELDVGKDYM